MNYFPLFADLSDRKCLVVGGGEVAERKVRLLLAAGARVTVNAPILGPGLAGWRDEGRITHAQGRFDAGLLPGQRLVIAATTDRSVNRQVCAASERLGILANAVDDPAAGSFIVPAVVDRDPLIVAVSSGGAAPVLARRLRQWLEVVLPHGLGALARLAGEMRRKVKRRLVPAARRGFWEAQLAGRFAGLALAGEESRARQAFHLELERAATAPAASGSICLVGAGPGDPALLTLKALRRLAEADVVLHDRLVSSETLALARRDAELIAVGKYPGGGWTQQEIHQEMIRHATAGRRVVRLKGGDPFVFGRGGEELAAAQAARIPCEIVPGITAALGCGAATGLPLTLRGSASALTLITAQGGDELDTLDWPGLGAAGHTVVVYMGVGRAAAIRDRLLGHGRAPATPVAIIEDGTMTAQRCVKGSLAELAELIVRHDIRAPALLVIGETAALARDGSPPRDARSSAGPAGWVKVALAG
jgi:uroporphyrin-III C-methyltransferase/precorrin-2 dehydrogenase/sirohydrochlorin ferrochelatase